MTNNFYNIISNLESARGNNGSKFRKSMYIFFFLELVDINNERTIAVKL